MVGMLPLPQMRKSDVMSMFGSGAAVAKAIGVTRQAVYQWPEVLPPRIEDRVMAALARKMHGVQSSLWEMSSRSEYESRD